MTQPRRSSTQEWSGGRSVPVGGRWGRRCSGITQSGSWGSWSTGGGVDAAQWAGHRQGAVRREVGGPAAVRLRVVMPPTEQGEVAAGQVGAVGPRHVVVGVAAPHRRVTARARGSADPGPAPVGASRRSAGSAAGHVSAGRRWPGRSAAGTTPRHRRLSCAPPTPAPARHRPPRPGGSDRPRMVCTGTVRFTIGCPAEDADPGGWSTGRSPRRSAAPPTATRPRPASLAGRGR